MASLANQVDLESSFLSYEEGIIGGHTELTSLGIQTRVFIAPGQHFNHEAITQSPFSSIYGAPIFSLAILDTSMHTSALNVLE